MINFYRKGYSITGGVFNLDGRLCFPDPPSSFHLVYPQPSPINDGMFHYFGIQLDPTSAPATIHGEFLLEGYDANEPKAGFICHKEGNFYCELFELY